MYKIPFNSLKLKIIYQGQTTNLDYSFSFWFLPNTFYSNFISQFCIHKKKKKAKVFGKYQEEKESHCLFLFP